MSANSTRKTYMIRVVPVVIMALVLLLATAANAAAPGITGTTTSTGTTFNLVADRAFITQPDGQAIYSWGYGCDGAAAGYAPAAITSGFCNSMQIPGPTLIVTQGQVVTVKLRNNLPAAAGNTSILFPGFSVQSSGGVAGLLTQEAAPGGTVQYTFTATTPGTRAYYSGSQGDLQVEMGLYGAIIVIPSAIPSNCTNPTIRTNLYGVANYASSNNIGTEQDFRLAKAAYNHPEACYDREYLFQFSEMDPNIHRLAEEQVTTAATACAAGAGSPGCSLNVPTEPYHPAYFMINGRSMPDNMDANYASQYPHQPYNGDPHMHPGELTLIRVIGQGRWQHPFHEHGNHVRILARDGNLLLSTTNPAQYLEGPLLFTTTTTPGQAFDGIFYWTAKGLNWDAYGHNPNSTGNAVLPCNADTNGYNTGIAAQTQINYYEWCQDHNKPLQVAPFGDVAGGGPATLPDPNILTNGPWFGGSPYLGPDATLRATGCMPSSAAQTNSPNCGNTGVTPPSGTIANPPASEAGFAFMWHSHNEREITTNNIFPGGMLMMMLVDSREFVIDETR